jgi:hypothetical protein
MLLLRLKQAAQAISIIKDQTCNILAISMGHLHPVLTHPCRALLHCLLSCLPLIKCWMMC